MLHEGKDARSQWASGQCGAVARFKNYEPCKLNLQLAAACYSVLILIYFLFHSQTKQSITRIRLQLHLLNDYRQQ